MNLSPIISAKPAAVARKAPTYDCGPAGHLTVRQIMERTGLRRQSVQARLNRGRTGAQILAGRLVRVQDVPTYDCGKAGRLTIAQIAKRAGISHSGAARRVRNGLRGERLLVGAVRKERTDSPARPSLLRALRIVRAFPDTVPTVRQLQKVCPMSRSNAVRYQAALRDVLEAA